MLSATLMSFKKCLIRTSFVLEKNCSKLFTRILVVAQERIRPRPPFRYDYILHYLNDNEPCLRVLPNSIVVFTSQSFPFFTSRKLTFVINNYYVVSMRTTISKKN